MTIVPGRGDDQLRPPARAEDLRDTAGVRLLTTEVAGRAGGGRWRSGEVRWGGMGWRYKLLCCCADFHPLIHPYLGFRLGHGRYNLCTASR